MEQIALATLVGSEKQIAWATDVRSRLLAWTESFIAAAEQLPGSLHGEVLGRIEEVRSKIAATTDIKWFIETMNRVSGLQIVYSTVGKVGISDHGYKVFRTVSDAINAEYCKTDEQRAAMLGLAAAWMQDRCPNSEEKEAAEEAGI